MTAVQTISQDEVVRLVQAHQAEVWRYLRYLGASAELADDLTQDTFLQLLRAPFAVRSPQQTAGWLRTVARNLFVRAFRRPPFELAELETMEAAWSGFAGDDAGGEALARLRGCLERLDGRARDAVGELIATLDRQRGGVVAGQLGGLYTFFLRELTSLGIDPAVERLDRVTAMVRELREAFVEKRDANLRGGELLGGAEGAEGPERSAS